MTLGTLWSARLRLKHEKPPVILDDEMITAICRAYVELEEEMRNLREWPCEDWHYPDCATSLGDVIDAPCGDEEPNQHSPIWFCGHCRDRFGREVRANEREACAKIADFTSGLAACGIRARK